MAPKKGGRQTRRAASSEGGHSADVVQQNIGESTRDAKAATHLESTRPLSERSRLPVGHKARGTQLLHNALDSSRGSGQQIVPPPESSTLAQLTPAPRNHQASSESLPATKSRQPKKRGREQERLPTKEAKRPRGSHSTKVLNEDRAATPDVVPLRIVGRTNNHRDYSHTHYYLVEWKDMGPGWSRWEYRTPGLEPEILQMIRQFDKDYKISNNPSGKLKKKDTPDACRLASVRPPHGFTSFALEDNNEEIVEYFGWNGYAETQDEAELAPDPEHPIPGFFVDRDQLVHDVEEERIGLRTRRDGLGPVTFGEASGVGLASVLGPDEAPFNNDKGQHGGEQGGTQAGEGSGPYGDMIWLGRSRPAQFPGLIGWSTDDHGGERGEAVDGKIEDNSKQGETHAGQGNGPYGDVIWLGRSRAAQFPRLKGWSKADK